VLAQEELGKALWIYDTFATAWNTAAVEPYKVDRLAKHGRDHVQKYLEAFVFGDELAAFWGDYSSLDHRQEGESLEDAWKRRRGEAEAGPRCQRGEATRLLRRSRQQRCDFVAHSPGRLRS
jgi:AbiV family abortive infection protein